MILSKHASKCAHDLGSISMRSQRISGGGGNFFLRNCGRVEGSFDIASSSKDMI